MELSRVSHPSRRPSLLIVHRDVSHHEIPEPRQHERREAPLTAPLQSAAPVPVADRVSAPPVRAMRHCLCQVGSRTNSRLPPRRRPPQRPTKSTAARLGPWARRAVVQPAAWLLQRPTRRWTTRPNARASPGQWPRLPPMYQSPAAAHRRGASQVLCRGVHSMPDARHSCQAGGVRQRRGRRRLIEARYLSGCDSGWSPFAPSGARFLGVHHAKT